MLPNVEKSIYRVFRKAFFFKQKKDIPFKKNILLHPISSFE